MKVVLVDDELPALNAMQYLLAKYAEVEIVGVFTDPHHLLAEVNRLQPDVLFLDIEMRDLNGLLIAEKLYESVSDLHIVFVTAYNEYAVSAFELNAVDYLLKPVSEKRLQKTIQRILRENRGGKPNDQQVISTGDSSQRIQVRCFGRFQVSGGGLQGRRIVKWRTAKAEELFAFFIHYYGSSLHKDFILEQLWPNTFYENALPKLHTAISQIRKVIKSLNPEAELRFSHDCYQLILMNWQSELDEFKQLVKEANEARDEDLIKIANTIIDLYRGHYVEENGYLWSLDESRRAADQFTNLLTRVVESCLRRKQSMQAIGYLRQLIQQNPLNEGYYRQLFSLYAQAADFTSLTELYGQLTIVLHRELGVAPTQETRALYESLQAGLCTESVQNDLLSFKEV